ncbi:MAG: hypothetical protein U1F98_14215 [Verrucomicrobiota bacterium]
MLLYGPAGTEINIERSYDLVNWVFWARFHFGGNTYEFTDAAIGSSAHCFYRCRSADGCSVNTVGFVKTTVPSHSTIGVSNPLDNPQGKW